MVTMAGCFFLETPICPKQRFWKRPHKRKVCYHSIPHFSSPKIVHVTGKKNIDTFTCPEVHKMVIHMKCIIHESIPIGSMGLVYLPAFGWFLMVNLPVPWILLGSTSHYDFTEVSVAPDVRQCIRNGTTQNRKIRQGNGVLRFEVLKNGGSSRHGIKRSMGKW